MHAEQAFLLVYFAIVAFFFVKAYRDGVVGMMWSVAGVLGGLIGGWFFYTLIPDLLPNWEGGFRSRLFLSALVGIIPYLIVRFAAKALLTRLFEPDSVFGFLADGIGGGLLSLIPSFVVILILTAVIRFGGTWADLRRYEALVTPGIDLLEKDYPARPKLAAWRDGVESLPLVSEVFSIFDETNRVHERNLLGVLITTKKEELFEYLSHDPEIRPVIESGSFARLQANEEVMQLLKDRQHWEVLQREEVHTAARDTGIRDTLEELELHRLVDEFMLSPDRQHVLESLERR